MGISFFYPAEYADRKADKQTTQPFNDYKIPITRSILSKPDQGQVAIRVERTDDPKILDYLSLYHPLEEVRAGQVRAKKYYFDGEADTTGFVMKLDMKYVILSFDFPPPEEVMEKVLGSVSSKNQK